MDSIPIDGKQLDVMVQMASYMPFDKIEGWGDWHWVLAYIDIHKMAKDCITCF